MHKLLKAQISKFLGGELPEHPAMERFIEAINKTYTANDKDIDCLDRITELSRQQHFHKSEKRYRDMINSSQALIFTHDLQGKILSVNPAVCAKTGYVEKELVGQFLVEFIPQESRANFKDDYLRKYLNKDEAEGVLAFVNKNKETVFLLYKNFLTEDEDSEPYINSFAQDITDRIIAEKELKIAQEAAQESLHLKELFLSNISHELCTPMNGIVGLTNLLLKSPLNERQQQYTALVKQSAEGLLEIVNGILQFNNVQADNMRLKEIAFDISNLIYNISYTYNLEAQRKGLQLITLLDDDLPEFLTGDPARLNQVLVNLMSNAIKFTDSGKIILRVARITEQADHIRLRFSITDTGEGIPENKIKTVFNSFTQGNADYSRKYGGTGLGLSIVSKLLGLMNSKIEVASKEGEGSEFSFELSFMLPTYITLNKKTTPVIDTAGKLKGLRILLAEDNKVNQLFAHELINDWGASLDIAANGKQALEYINQNTYDLILMDIQMPEMSGMEATEIIRNDLQEPNRSIKIIAVTANAMKCEDKKYMDAGMNDVLFKPYQPQDLFNKIISNVKWTMPVESKTVEIENKIIVEQPVTFPTDLKYASLETIISFSRGKKDFVIKMLNVILKEVPVMMIDLNQHLTNQDWHQASRVAHKMIPNMNMTGNEALEDHIRHIELNAEESMDKNEVMRHFEAASHLWRNVKTEIETVLAQNEKTN